MLPQWISLEAEFIQIKPKRQKLVNMSKVNEQRNERLRCCQSHNKTEEHNVKAEC